MGNYARAKLTQFLPSTPCTPEMRSQMLIVAEKSGVSLAEIQRRAFSLFLSKTYSKATEEVSDAIDQALPEHLIGAN